MDKFYDILESICFSFIIVTVVILFIGRVIVVDGDSMNDTLYSGEKIITTNILMNIKKGDIVVTDGRVHSGRPIIKRVIATGGDSIRIDIITGEVYVNNNLLQEDYIKEKMLTDTTESDIDMVIPQGYLFLMGDNRNYSLDSRSEQIGIVSEKDILGKAIMRISPFSKIGMVN